MEEPRRLPGSVVELGHVVLYVSDLERSAAFYRDILGWPTVGEPRGVPAMAFSAGRTHHELMLIEVGPDAERVPEGPRLGMYHFGVKVGDRDDDLRAVLERLESRPDLAQVEGLIDGGFVHSIYLSDPDGNELELYIDVPGWDWTDPDTMRNARRRRLTL